MKKTTQILAGLFAGLMVSVSANAANYPQNLNPGPNDILMTDCGMLANDISVTLSANVTGGFACDAATSKSAVSVCHTKGLKTDRSSVVTKDGTGAVICTVVAGTEDCVVTVTGSVYPTVSTEDGTVAALFPGSVCSQTNAQTIANGLTP